jgi:endogenous inhibitor of DNA gyrase (YacG/DUF329 family)
MTISNMRCDNCDRPVKMGEAFGVFNASYMIYCSAECRIEDVQKWSDCCSECGGRVVLDNVYTCEHRVARIIRQAPVARMD